MFTIKNLKDYFRRNKLPDEMPIMTDAGDVSAISVAVFGKDKPHVFCLTVNAHVLEIFDLTKGEKPNDRETVSAYFELVQTWQEFVWRTDTDRFSDGLQIFGLNEVHRWTRLPILDKE